MTKAKSSAQFQIIPPADTPEYMYPAYFGCLSWAIRRDDIHRQYTAATGKKYDPPKNGLHIMIDEVTGSDPAEEFLRFFLPWFNDNVWGKVDGVDMDE